MSEIKQQLKEIIESKMIPECKTYLEDLDNIMDGQGATQDDQEAVDEMEAFLKELQNILQAIEEDDLTDNDAQMILNKILELLEAHAE